MAQREASLDGQLVETVNFIRSKTSQKPRVGVILGSGLGSFADTLEGLEKIPTESIPHFPRSTVQGHQGFLVFGRLEGVPILAVQGRTHVYEGHPVDRVAYVVRVMAELGVKKLLVTNAAGGTNPLFRPGDLMIIVDHINFLFRNPLRGPVVDAEPRFPDMYGNYHPSYIELIERIGLEEGIPLRKGVLFVSTGPSYETAAEVQMIRRLGGDAASMSTVPEVLVARARGIKVAGISCITNLATGLSPTPLSHEEVTEIAGQVQEKFRRLVRRVLVEMDRTE
ncbi:MAG: purine-nucleoside phosphorylase [Calditrichaeota bacterium]|nr:MAG: purine-nucleoside phosphorylase [Calditrichota bacterium]